MKPAKAGTPARRKSTRPPLKATMVGSLADADLTGLARLLLQLAEREGIDPRSLRPASGKGEPGNGEPAGGDAETR